jgi:hypothetical protein
MKLLITESKLKTFIKDKFNIDLTGRVELDPSIYSLLNDFDFYFTYDGLRRRQLGDNYGPIYLIELDDNRKVLYQMNYSSNHPLILDSRGDLYEESEFMDMLGIRALGLNLEQFLDLYI